MTTYIVSENRYGYDFIAGEHIPPGKDEYYLRDEQLAALYPDAPVPRTGTYRHLTGGEVRSLEANGNTAVDWGGLWVTGGFNPALLRDNYFAGRVRLGAIGGGLLRYHDYTLPVGITKSRIISCDIGDHCAIHNCRYMSHYIIGDGVILSSIGEMDTTNHAKFGQGVLKAGEDEAIRVWIDPLNEAGGRSILAFDGMIAADAYLWTVFREDRALMAAFKRMTQEGADSRRGFYGTIGHGTVIKHCHTIKDVRVGDAAYIKGANKLKNLTVKSGGRDPTQIGEGVELVNGIIGYGCRVFYGSKAVRFVLGNNCALKYGARLIHSVLGDNSTISCCEVLNNLVFPAHEQHHNNSFLIAAMIMGGSNMAAGATVGSNHNSRGNDGELIAGRGFWAGLSSTLKHNSRFASFTLVAKGSYPAELNIPLPFSLVGNRDGGGLEVMPAYWWMHNMYALERNAWKLPVRDQREFIVQRYETAYLAPDTAEEIVRAIGLLEGWLAEGADHIVLPPRIMERTDRPVHIVHARRALASYRQMLVYYAVDAIGAYSAETYREFVNAHPEDVPLGWENLGGQLVPAHKAESLRRDIREGRIATWEAVHGEYERLWREYPGDKALNALGILRFLGCQDDWDGLREEAARIREHIAAEVRRTKAKDFDDPFRAITYRGSAEQRAVLGDIDDNPFVARFTAQRGI
ncbi:MAG: DUF4954 family protein [Spirochaetaceae bacterium]|jgi:NDP-sugar pyrophosphorylase family protein|nr:DUF4954 family protein [Spirochaetaceae bacterium]